MAVEGVNNSNNNAGLYALGAAAIGGGAGAGVAYMTKPFLKDGAPTDEFVKSAGEKLLDEATNVSKEEKAFFKEVSPMMKKLAEASNVEEYKQITNKMFDSCIKAYPDVESLKKALSEGGQLSALIMNGKGREEVANLLETVNSASNVDEIKQVLRNNVNNEIAAKGFEVVKKEQSELIKALKQAGVPLSYEDLGRMSISEVLKDGKLENNGALTEEAFNIIKKAAKNIQGKYAMIYGSIAAAVLGIGTYLATSGNKEAPIEKVDTQA